MSVKVRAQLAKSSSGHQAWQQVPVNPDTRILKQIAFRKKLAGMAQLDKANRSEARCKH